MREELAKKNNEREVFTGIFVRFGTKNGYKHKEPTVLLQDIQDKNSKIVTDHLWFNYTKLFKQLWENDNLHPGTLIENYDMKMSNKRAFELRDEITHKFNEFFKDRNYDEVFINLGKYYSKATYYCSSVNAKKWIISKGAIGEKMSQLKEWLLRIQKKEGVLNYLVQTKKMGIENESN